MDFLAALLRLAFFCFIIFIAVSIFVSLLPVLLVIIICYLLISRQTPRGTYRNIRNSRFAKQWQQKPRYANVPPRQPQDNDIDVDYTVISEEKKD